MPTLYVVRHAEPSLTGVLLGGCDPPLSERGKASLRNIALDVRVVYASTMLRSRQTAEAIAQAAPIVTLPELDEISYGEWDGRTWQEIEERDPELARRKLADWKGIAPPGGEAWAHFEARVLEGFERIRSGPFPAAVVGHSAVNAVIASRLCGAETLGWEQGYGEIHAIDL